MGIEEKKKNRLYEQKESFILYSSTHDPKLPKRTKAEPHFILKYRSHLICILHNALVRTGT